MTQSTPKLFQPIKLGDLQLQHRVVLAPMTRLRNTADAIPLSLVKEYYSQRASTPGTFLLTEGTFIAHKASGFPNVPGIYTKEQIAAWKEVVQEVHAKDSFIFLQIAAMGRGGFDPSIEVVGPSDIPIKGGTVPRPLTVDEIKEYYELFAQAALAAVNGAGFDGVEIHGANGFLVDQFIQDVSNNRTDEYGGSIENRSRFPLGVLEAMTKAVGPKKVGLRLSPWSTNQDMGMKDPVPTFAYLVRQIKERFPDLAYIHAIEARVAGDIDLDSGKHDSNAFMREIWAPKPFLSAGGYNNRSGIEDAEKNGSDLIVYGRYFLSTPDLPRRLKEGIAPNDYDRSTFYSPGDASGKGYTDYPFAK